MKYMINLLSLAGLAGAAVALMCVPEIQTDLRYCLVWCAVIVLSLIGRLWLWGKEREDEERDAPCRKFYDIKLR